MKVYLNFPQNALGKTKCFRKFTSPFLFQQLLPPTVTLHAFYCKLQIFPSSTPFVIKWNKNDVWVHSKKIETFTSVKPNGTVVAKGLVHKKKQHK